jgi:hypothetical protein
MLTESVVGERRAASGVQSDSRGGPYGELIVNDVGLGRYFETCRLSRIFILSTAVGATLNGNASPLGSGGTPVWALFNPPSNSRAAVILKASCLLVPGASATPIIPVWNFLTDLTGQSALGSQASVSAIISSTGAPGTMRSFIGQALTGGTVASTFLRNWMGNFNDPRHAGAASETAGGVVTEETEGSLIVPPGTILSVTFNVAGAAVTGCVSVVYAEVDWPL